MTRNRYLAICFGLVGGILIGLGVFFVRTGGWGRDVNIQISNDKFPINTNGQNEVYKTNINIATQVELETLPKIGEVTARKIILGRPYGQIEELVIKKIVTEKVFLEISSWISAQ